jgi:DNA-binding SARP family transcriptional activator
MAGGTQVGAGVLATRSLEFRVLGTFRFRVQGRAPPAVRGGQQRLAALLGIRDRARTPANLVGALWPDSAEDHACSCLRSALRRLSRMARDAVELTPLDRCVADGVTVDIRQSRALAHRLLGPIARSPREGPCPRLDRR